ncbi:MAG: indole-3-glycerol phosphate synthase TrpC, partial [Candidatus Cybelea sp.]
MSDTLQKIYAAKAALLVQEQAREPYEVLRERAFARMGERRGFLAALRNAPGGAIVAEIKRASPSSGLIARSFDPAAIGRAYDAAGVDAISILTERDHFLGELAYLDEVRAVTSRPLLRKDFMWTRYQVAQSAAYGADCVLLIVAGMEDSTLRESIAEAAAYALDVLVEAHDEDELRRAIAAGARMVGINNRNLRTLETDLAVSEYLLPKVPPEI